MPSVLAILEDGFEELEAIASIDLLRRGEVQVTTAACGDRLELVGRSRIQVKADCLLSHAPQHFDCLLLPGGPAVASLRSNPAVRSLARAQREKDRWIAAICAAPLVLLDAGLLEGYRFTCHPSAATELPQSLQSERCLVDRRLITSRGAGTAIEFGLKIVSCLVSPAKAEEVGKAIAI